MYKLWAAIIKDVRILMRDKLGLAVMFVMPILLVIVITKVQNNTFELLNNNSVPLLIANRDTGSLGNEMMLAVEKIGMFKVIAVSENESDMQLTYRMHLKDALLALVIPDNFTSTVALKAKKVAAKALIGFGLDGGDTSMNKTENKDSIILFYHPILQEAYKLSVRGALESALKMVENKQSMKQLYFSLNEKELPASMENDLFENRSEINEIPISRDGSRTVPNASQHNVPAWTIFAMFFVVMSLGSGIVREKQSGSFTRLKTLPTNYLISILSKQITYLCVTMIQAALIFSVGVLLFPYLNLPVLSLPTDILGLIIVTLFCGLCAVNYAICVGIFAETQEQSNGYGAVSIVILAALGGLMVPEFAMPGSFSTIMKLSPLHWCLEAYYGLFLERGRFTDVLRNIIPLLAIAVIFMMMAIWGLKRKKLI